MKKDVKLLEKTLGLADVVMFGIGGVVGAGIYAIIGEAAGLSGPMLWLSFTIAAIVALLTGLAYAEFVSVFPDAGGSFEYIKQGFGEKTALYMSIIILLTAIISPAAIAISFSDYLSRLIELPEWIATASIIILMAIINIIGIKQSSWFNMAATIITLAGLAVVIFFAIPYWELSKLTVQREGQGMSGVLAGSALIFFSYVGFEDMAKTAEEVKRPEINMPKGIIYSGFIVLLIYLLIAVSAVSVIDPLELAGSKGPLALVLKTAAGPGWVTLLVIVALFATSKTILSNVLGASRILFDVGRDSDISWLKRFSKVRKSTGTPVIAILGVSVIVAAFSLIGNLKVVASLSNIFVFILFISVNIALLRFRKKHKRGTNAYFRVPFNIYNIPIPTLIAIVGLLVLLVFNIYNLI